MQVKGLLHREQGLALTTRTPASTRTLEPAGARLCLPWFRAFSSTYWTSRMLFVPRVFSQESICFPSLASLPWATSIIRHDLCGRSWCSSRGRGLWRPDGLCKSNVFPRSHKKGFVWPSFPFHPRNSFHILKRNFTLGNKDCKSLYIYLLIHFYVFELKNNSYRQ